jgi:dTDP-4-dehydrorhamnose 3,5-epimerase-like enzyme
MSKIIEIPTSSDERGSLSVIEKIAQFVIKRVYYIYNTDQSSRGGHRHKKTRQILVCINGSCKIYSTDEFKTSKVYYLNKPDQGLILEPSDWHTMGDFSSGSVLLVLASEHYDKNDYIDEKY